MTIRDIITKIKSELNTYYEENEINSFTLIIFDFVLGYKRIDIELNKTKKINESEILQIEELIKKLQRYVPIQYITGTSHFYGLDFCVNENVLIPRPETEELVDKIIRENLNSEKKLNIIDIGTGSGCISVSISKNLKNTEVYAIDISLNALEVAKLNAGKNSCKINFAKADILNFRENEVFTGINFDIIISNPPYVRHSEKKLMQKNVLDFEPELALFVKDEKPLIFYEAIKNFALKKITKSGIIYLEINEFLGSQTAEIFKPHFENVQIFKDINRKDRMLKISNPKF